MSSLTSNGPSGVHFRHNTHENKGQIQVIFGPMFSGKTTELLRRIKRYQVAKYRCCVIKYENDKRYDKDDVSTHDMQKAKAISCSNLASIKSKVMSYEVIGVDEGQFFPDTVQFCEDMAKQRKTIIVAALDGDFQRKPFGNIIGLVPLAESVIKLTAVCMNCYGEGSFTKRICGDTQLEVIGGADKYMAACRDCHDNDIVDDEKKILTQQHTKKKVLNSVENLQGYRPKENVVS